MRIQKLLSTATLPQRGTPGAAGYDLVAAEPVTIPPSRSHDGLVDVGHAMARTGLAIELPPNTVGRIGSRSGLSTKRNIETGAGWIDPDYRGELLIELKNFSSEEVMLDAGSRIAQLFILRTLQPKMVESPGLSKTDRQAGGFGSTGLNVARKPSKKSAAKSKTKKQY